MACHLSSKWFQACCIPTSTGPVVWRGHRGDPPLESNTLDHSIHVAPFVRTDEAEQEAPRDNLNLNIERIDALLLCHVGRAYIVVVIRQVNNFLYVVKVDDAPLTHEAKPLKGQHVPRRIGHKDPRKKERKVEEQELP